MFTLSLVISFDDAICKIDSNVTEINMYENIFSNTLEVTMVVVDQNNIIMNMPIVGQEYVHLKLETPSVGVFDNNFDSFFVFFVINY